MTVDRGAAGDSAGRAPTGRHAGPLSFRSAPVLEVQQSQLVEFFSRGHRYDHESVAAAVKEGNTSFDARDLSRAFDAYGVAYELARLTFDYRPLLYDLLIRRVICRSMLGDVDGALMEVSLAEQVVPHESTIHLLRGLLHMKLGGREVASHCLQQAAATNRELRSLVESLVGLCWLRWGECDKAVKTCSRVLSRTPGCPLALLARRDAYRSHPSGRFARQAEADSTAASALGVRLPARVGQRLDASEPCQLDELLLHFHPALQEQGPRPYEEYAACPSSGGRPRFVAAAWVALFVARLRGSLGSARLAEGSPQRDGLVHQRAQAEARLWELLRKHKCLPTQEGSRTAMWGPADPTKMHSKKYRRYRLDWPASCPERREDACANPAAAEPTAMATSLPEPATPLLKPACSLDETRLVAQDPPPADATFLGERGFSSLECSNAGRRCGPDGDIGDPRAAPPAAAPDPGTVPAAVPSHRAVGRRAAPPAPGDSRAEAWAEPAEQAPPALPRTGAGWGESDWAAKALALVGAPDPPGSPGRPHCPPGSGGAGAVLPLPGGAGEDVSVVRVVERCGWGAIPDWYPALDRIYDLGCMAHVCAKPEPLVPGHGLVADAGCSFAVPTRAPRAAACGGDVFAQAKERVAAASRAASAARRQRLRLSARG